jgi:DNA invertase Pin-like site-specific DNA recombinase
MVVWPTCSPRPSTPAAASTWCSANRSIDRLARRTYIGTTIEHQLEQVDVRLYAADEPIDPRGKRSTGLLTRRVKQGVAEWYVTDMLEHRQAAVRVCGRQG